MDMSMPTSSNRILYDVPCAVCRDHSSGKHYGVFACDGCAGFFKRSVRRDRQYLCKARVQGLCLVDKAHRNQCRACRMAKCLKVGMNKDAVQHERGPRNSTIRRQMAMFFKDSAPPPESHTGHSLPPPLDLAMNKQNFLAPPPMTLFASPYYARLRYTSPPIFADQVPSPNISPTPVLITSETDALCESAARILFMNVKWAKSVPAFASLSLSDRLVLLVESWRDLFVLATAQFMFPVNLNILLNADTNPEVRAGVEAFERVLAEIVMTRLDTTEFACLRGLMVFKTTFEGPDSAGPRGVEVRRLQDVATVATLQDHSRNILSEYLIKTSPLESVRISQIYQLLHNIQRVPGNAIVDLFFRPTIGEIPIEKIICDMYQSDKSII